MNILRGLLEKGEITPEEVASLPYRVVVRSPGVGRQSLEIIRSWLHAHGLDLRDVPMTGVSRLATRRQHKLERAIDYLKEHGYEVTRSR